MRPARIINLVLAISVAASFFGGCAEPVEDIDRVQPYALPKSMFDGEWYFARTIVDAPYETSSTFVGDRQEYRIGGEDFPAYKVRWRIENNLLLACRVDEPVIGSNFEGRTAGDEHDVTLREARRRSDLPKDHADYMKFPCRYPVASFRITKHFDIIRGYSSTTGEQSNVISENSSDRHWHEREYIRVNWSNLMQEIDLSLMGTAALGWTPIAGPSYVIEDEDTDCRRQITEEITDYSQCEEGYLPWTIEDLNGDDVADAMNFTTRFSLNPENGSFSGIFACWISSVYAEGMPCTASEVGMRYSFLRVPQRPATEAYEPLYYPDEMFERFGVWRVIKETFQTGRGQTDFKQYLGTRFKIWKETHSCDGDGNCTPLPISAREFNPIVYHLNREFPADLKKAAFEIGKEWNDAFNGIHPEHNLEETCQIKCAAGTKNYADCSREDTNWTMEGICAFKVVENDGNKFLGDLRYNYMAYIEDPGMRTPCGIGGPANDPEDGELINAVSYVYGGSCFDYIETRMTEYMDVLCAQEARRNPDAELPTACDGIDEHQYLRGLRTLEIMQAQGYTQGPSTPIRGLTQASYQFTGEDAAEHMHHFHQGAEERSHHRGEVAARAERARQAGLSRLMIDDDMAKVMTQGQALTATDLTQEQVDFLDPTKPFSNGLMARQQYEHYLNSRAMDTGDFIFNDNGLWHFVNMYKNVSREEMRQVFREQMFKATTLHEIGHNVGLRHNFVASFDRAHYFPKYWDIIEQAREQFTEQNGRAPVDFEPFRDEDETAEQFGVRYKQWAADTEQLRAIKEGLGIRLYRYSSIMDYHGTLYGDWQGLGSYDKAAIRFIYGGLVDRVEGCDGTRPEDCLEKVNIGTEAEPKMVRKLHNRTYVPWYRGGKLCQTDEDCPSAANGQKCRLNEAFGASFCSNWDDDEVASGRYSGRQAFCSDDRVADKPFCNRFDEGETSEEIVRNTIASYERGFVRNNFRHHRVGFNVWSYRGRVWGRYFSVIGNQMQSLLYKYYYEPGFRSNSGPGGFEDMFRATVRGFDFLSNILAQPEAGSYEWDEDEQAYRFLDKELVDPDITGNDLINIPLGQGKTLYSSYEKGYFGEMERLAYVGIYHDKVLALRALTSRWWGAQAGQNDERFTLAFSDFFPTAFLNVVGGFMSGDYDTLGMVYDSGSGDLQQRTFWDGSFFGDEVEMDENLLNPAGRRVRPGASSLLNIYSLIYGFLYTPIYYDLSFINEGRVFEVGGETGFDIDHLSGNEYTECVSPLTGRRFVAVHTEAVRESIAQRTLTRCQDLADRYNFLKDALQANAEDPGVALPEGMDRDLAERKMRRSRNLLETQEDIMSNLVRVIDIFGIGSL